MKYRQGDVLIKSVDKIRGKKKENLVLAYGEVTGHRHEVVADVATLYEENGMMYLHIEDEKATLYHGTTEQIEKQKEGIELDYGKEDCHKPVVLPKGNYEINIQREYTPKGWQKVAD